MMTELILSASLKGGVLALLVLALQWVAGDRIPARWRYGMWLIVFLRLALPVAPSSDLSLFNLFNVPAFGPRWVAMTAQPPVRPVILGDLPTPVEVILAPPDLGSIARIAGGVWLAVVLLLILRLLVSSFRLHWRLRSELRASAEPPPALQDLLEQCRKALGVREEIRVLETSQVATPALHGIIRPKLLLPTGFFRSFDRDEMRFIFLHELAHLRRLDVIANWVIVAIQIVHWFNPLVWIAAMRIREERELACDELALDCLQQDERPRYGRTILKLLEVFRSPTVVPTLLGILSNKHQMKRRLLMITRFHSQPRITLLMLAMLTALAAVSLTDASAGEAHRMLKALGAAERATLHKLDARVSFELANATLADVLAAITARTGVAIAQAPEALSDTAQQKRITIAADQVPGHVVLVETLAALGLGFDPTADGIVINNKPRPGHMMLIEGPDDGKKIERKIVKRLGPAPGGELDEDEIELEIDGPPTEEEGKRIIIRKLGSDDHEASPDGTIRRNVVLKMKENGVKAVGKLKLEVRPN